MSWSPADAMLAILDEACPAVVHDDGYAEYYIETHCRDWLIIAKKDRGVWKIKSYS